MPSSVMISSRSRNDVSMNKFLILGKNYIAGGKPCYGAGYRTPNIRKNSYWPGRNLRSE
jgi:hypothetical protein